MRRLESAKRVKVKVDSGSIIYVDRNVYSVNSRLIGEQVEARLSAETVEVWYAGQKVEQTAAVARPGQASRRLPAHHRLAGAQAGRVRELPLSRRAVSDEPVPHGVGRLAGTGSAPRQQALPGRSCNWRHRKAKREWTAPCAGVLEEGEIGEGKLNVDAIRTSLDRGGQRVAGHRYRRRRSGSGELRRTARRHPIGGDAMSQARDVNKELNRVPAGIAPAGHPRLLRGKGPPSRTGNLGLRALPARAGRARVPGAARPSHHAPAAGFQAAAGEDHGELRHEAVAGESGPPSRRRCWTARFWTGGKMSSPSAILAAARRTCCRRWAKS